MIEEWRDVPSMPGYAASSLGRVRGKTGRIMKPSLTRNGYLYVHAAVVTTVNRIVCEAFHGTPPTPLHQAAHNNGVRTDNRQDNLRWVTRPENYLDQVRHGTSKRGEGHHLAKLTEQDVREIRRLGQTMKQGLIAKMFGVRSPAISRILSGKRWGHL